jgi:hypothetical protein
MSKKQSGPIDFFEVIGAIPYLFGAYDFCWCYDDFSMHWI